MQGRRYINQDPDSQQNVSEYHELLGSIERRMDPKSNTVLLVDDSRLVRKTVSRSLTAQDPNIVIYQAGDGQEGLERLNEIREKHDRDPLFIVSDLEMPVMDGWEFIEHLRKDYEDRGKSQGIPLIVLSSSTGERGRLFLKKSVHAGKARYNPMVTVAKEDCVKPGSYDSMGEKGVSAWMKHFLRSSAPR